MELTRIRVKVDETDSNDRSFSYSNDQYSKEALLKSISLCGVLNPVVLKKNRVYQVITGFRRLEIAGELGLQDVPAYLVHPQASSEELFVFSILENQTSRTLDLFEKATLLSRLEQAKIPLSRILSVFMPLVGLAPLRQTRDELIAVAGLPGTVIDYILARNLSLRKIRHLKEFSEGSPIFLVEFLEFLSPSANVFEEVTKRLVEVGQRDAETLDRIIESNRFVEIMKDEAIEKAIRMKMLRERIFALRYPVLSTENKKIEDALKALDLPRCSDVKWDRSLEAKGLEVKLSLISDEDFEKSLRSLERLRSGHILDSFG